MKTTKQTLVQGLMYRQPVEIHGVKYLFLNCVQAEDGSGHCFNVTGVSEDGEKEITVFVRTVD